MNTPVSFEIAKLLKEKGIKIDTDEVIFYRDEVNNIEKHQIKNRDVLYSYTGMELHPTFDDNEYQTYTIADILMWLYEKHGIWIEAHRWTNQPVDDEVWENCFQAFVNGDAMSVSIFKTPTEAYETGIEYALNTLI